MIIPIGDRSGSVIEPLMTKQWFVDSKTLCEDVKKIIKKNELKFFPSSWMNTFKYWIDNIEPWCISRQIWWGHRIPVWYSNKNTKIVEKYRRGKKKYLKKVDLMKKFPIKMQMSWTLGFHLRYGLFQH